MLIAEMSLHSAFETLRERLDCLEEKQRRFSRTVPIADAVDRWMPHGGLSAGCIHEVKGASLASAIAFSSILSARLAGDQGNIVYIAPDRSLHPLGLLPYGMRLDQLLLVSVRRSEDLSWAVMESLRCSQVSAVMAILDGADLIASRRLQLAAESSGATAFLLGLATSAPIAAPITRWKVTSYFGKPGQRFNAPVWTLDLLYCRGGRSGSWIIEWRNQQLSTLFNQMTTHTTREALAG
ncbi:MAG: ImuA family protein [Bryobacteraceae bacterium]